MANNTYVDYIVFDWGPQVDRRFFYRWVKVPAHKLFSLRTGIDPVLILN